MTNTQTNKKTNSGFVSLGALAVSEAYSCPKVTAVLILKSTNKTSLFISIFTFLVKVDFKGASHPIIKLEILNKPFNHQLKLLH